MIVAQLIKALQGVPANTKVFLLSNEEGNSINNCVEIQRDAKGIYLCPDSADIQEGLNTPSPEEIEQALGGPDDADIGEKNMAERDVNEELERG